VHLVHTGQPMLVFAGQRAMMGAMAIALEERSASRLRIELVGEELRRYREARGITLAQAAERIGTDASRLSRMETGKIPQKCEDVAGLLAVYGVIGIERKQLLDLTRTSDDLGLWQRHSSSLAQRVATLRLLESRAIRLINFECEVIPGLLQTVPYAEHVLRNVGLVSDEEVVAERVAARVHRQAVLRRTDAPHLLAIIAQNALQNMIGDRIVMRDQLLYLTEAARRRNIEIRVIPSSVGNHPGFDGPFLRLQFADRAGVVVLVNRTSDLFLEDDEALMAYNNVLIELLNLALPEDESVPLIARLAATME
jgi:transcriptional regulator with XRE-family HTH domain